jgi:hypothetical protein
MGTASIKKTEMRNYNLQKYGVSLTEDISFPGAITHNDYPLVPGQFDDAVEEEEDVPIYLQTADTSTKMCSGKLFRRTQIKQKSISRNNGSPAQFCNRPKNQQLQQPLSSIDDMSEASSSSANTVDVTCKYRDTRHKGGSNYFVFNSYTDDAVETSPASIEGVKKSTPSDCMADENVSTVIVLKSSPFSNVLLPSGLDNLEQEHPHLSILPATNFMLPHIEPVSPNFSKMISYDCLNKLDVLLGRGHGINYYRGNRWFRKLLDCYRSSYCLAPKGDKKALCRNICSFIRLKGGRFLERLDSSQDPFLAKSTSSTNVYGTKAGLENSFWYECGDSKALSKIGQNLREGHATLVRKTIKRSMTSSRKNETEST